VAKSTAMDVLLVGGEALSYLLSIPEAGLTGQEKSERVRTGSVLSLHSNQAVTS